MGIGWGKRASRGRRVGEDGAGGNLEVPWPPNNPPDIPNLDTSPVAASFRKLSAAEPVIHFRKHR